MNFSTLTLVLIFTTTTIFYLISKGTYITLSPKKGEVWPLLIYRELITIFLPLLLINHYGIESFSDAIFNAKSNDVPWISLFSIYSVFAYLVTVSTAAKIIPIPSSIRQDLNLIYDKKIKFFADSSLVTSYSLFLFSFFFLSYKHAVLDSILQGGSLIQARLGNSYNSGLPSQFAYIIFFSALITSIFSGILLHQKKYYTYILYLFLAIFLASTRGDKAPIVLCIIVSLLSYSVVTGISVSPRKVFYIFLYFFIFYFIVFWITSLQIPDLDIEYFNIYLVNRLGIGQMSGVFETLSIPRIEGDFFWHVIPFASFFIDYLPYEKALMMTTEGYAFNEMGVKNSLFISEAFGIGGTTLALLSPIIVGLSYAIGIKIFYMYLNKIFGKGIASTYTLPLYILTTPLTGGFSSFPLFKGLILNLIATTIIFIIYLISKKINRLKLTI